MSKSTLAVIIAILLVAVVGLFLLWAKAWFKQDGTINLTHDMMLHYNSELARRDSIEYVQAMNTKRDSAKYAEKQDSLKTRIYALQRTVRKYRTVDLRKEVARLTPDSSETAVFVRYDSALSYRDSMIVAQDSLVSSLYADKAQTWKNFTAEIDGLQGKAKLSETYARSLERSLIDTEKQFRRQRRRERIAEGLVIAGVIVLSL